MTSNKISDLISIPELTDADLSVGVDATDSTTKKMTLGQVKDFAQTLRRTVVVDSDHVVVDTDELIAFTSITVPRTVSLPTAVGRTGHVVEVHDESGSVSGTNSITIDPAGTETIDGTATLTIATPRGSARIYSDGASWHVLREFPSTVDYSLLTELTDIYDVATRYFGSTGNDVTGDGSLTNPFREMQRCVDSIPPGCQGTLNFIALDAGPFVGFGAPDLRAGSEGLYVTFVGAGASVLTFATLPAGTHDANVAGGDKVGRFKHSGVGAHPALTAGSHWLKTIYDVGGGNLWYGGLIVDHLNSASPDLSIVSEFDRSLWGYTSLELVPFTSQLDSGGAGITYLRSVPQSNGAQIYVTGFWITELLFVVGSAIHLEGFAQKNTSSFINIYHDQTVESFEHHAIFNDGGCFLRGGQGIGTAITGIFNKTVDIENIHIHFNGACRAPASSSYSIRIGHFGPFGAHSGGSLMPNIDFENNAVTNIYARNSEVRLYDDGSQPTTDGTATNFLVAEHDSKVSARDDSLPCVMGSVTGVCVSLASGSQSRGLFGHGSSPALRNTTTPGDDVSIGADPIPRAFSSLPRTDVAEAIPQFVRAT